MEYKKTLFIPSILAQYKAWVQDILPECETSDEVIQFGNFISLIDEMKDGPHTGGNEKLSKLLLVQIANRPEWVQLVGPNEILALNFPDKWTNSKTNKMLRDLWFTERPRMLVASVNKGRLQSHSGLTYGEWVSLGRPQTAVDAANLINEKYLRTLYQGESFLLHGKPNYSANPIFADSYMEFYPSWITAPEECPFPQITGSASLSRQTGRDAIMSEYSPLKYMDKYSFKKTGSVSVIKGQTFMTLDLDFPNKLVTKVPSERSLYIEKSI